MKSIKLSIKKPCSTGTENFYPVGSGYYCTLCQKEVQDFTHYSNRELLEAFSENTDTSCGIFRKGQLDKKIKPPDEAQEFSLTRLLLSGLLITTELCLAQSDIKMDSIVATTKDSLEISSDSLSVDSDTASAEEDTLINASIENPHPETIIPSTTPLIQTYILGDFIVSGNISYVDHYVPGALINPDLLFNPPKDTIVETSENINNKSASDNSTKTPEPEEGQNKLHPLWVWIEERKRRLFESDE